MHTAGCECDTSHGTRLAPARPVLLEHSCPGTPHVGSGSMLLWHGRVFSRAPARAAGPLRREITDGRASCMQKGIRGPFQPSRLLCRPHHEPSERAGGCPMPARAEWSSEDPCRARTDTSYRLVRTNYTNAALQRRLDHPWRDAWSQRRCVQSVMCVYPKCPYMAVRS